MAFDTWVCKEDLVHIFEKLYAVVNLRKGEGDLGSQKL